MSKNSGPTVIDLSSHRLRSLLRTTDKPIEQKKAENHLSLNTEARLEATNGRPIAAFTPGPVNEQKTAVTPRAFPKPKPRGGEGGSYLPGIKKQRNGRSGNLDIPPTPYGCEWRRTDDGWSLWRCWSEKDESTGKRIKKSRYAGNMSFDAWREMKDYDYETFISIIGQRLRRYGKR